MKREILFKALRADGKGWVEGDLCQSQSPKVFIFPVEGMDSPDNYEVLSETVSQFTGMPDKNGKKVFEGDTLNGLVNMNGALLRLIFTVVYFEDGFSVVANVGNQKTAPLRLSDLESFEITGNTHDKTV